MRRTTGWIFGIFVFETISGGVFLEESVAKNFFFGIFWLMLSWVSFVFVNAWLDFWYICLWKSFCCCLLGRKCFFFVVFNGYVFLWDSFVFSLDLLQHVVFLRFVGCAAKRPKTFVVCLFFFLDFNLNTAQVKMYELWGVIFTWKGM